MVSNKSPSVIGLMKQAFTEWKEDNASRLAAALAYYTTFSMAPLLILIIAIAGLVGGQQAVHNQVMNQIEGLIGPQGRAFIESMITSASQPRNGLLASGIGIVTLLLGALGVFAELQSSLNTIWEVKPKPVKGMKQGAWRFIKQRMLSFSLVLAIGFVLLAALAVNAALSAFGNVILNSSQFSPLLLQVINELIPFFVITFLFALMFKFLPDAEIAWRDVWLGAAVTSLLFNLGKFAIGYYLGHSTVGSTFGAAGSLVLILIWVYYSAQIFFFGAEVTQVYANRVGLPIVPDEDAVKVTEQERAHQGIPHEDDGREREEMLEHERENR